MANPSDPSDPVEDACRVYQILLQVQIHANAKSIGSVQMHQILLKMHAKVIKSCCGSLVARRRPASLAPPVVGPLDPVLLHRRVFGAITGSPGPL